LTSEQEIVKGCIKKDKLAQKALFDSCAQKLYNVCFRYTNSQMDAEDLMQDAFILALQKIETFKGKSSLTSWVCAIGINLAIDKIRKMKNISFLEIDNIHQELPSEEAEMEVDNAPDAALALHAISKLPEGFQMVLKLYALEKFTHQQIADTLNISVGTSKSQLARARKKLAEILQKL